MMAVTFGPTSCSSGLVPKRKLLHSPEDHYGFVPKLSHHGGKNPALRAEKPILPRPKVNFFSGAQRNGFFPLRMSYVAKQCVLMSWLVRELASQAQSHGSGREARRAKTAKEGFLRFLLISET